ncbi:zinc-dependent metalloprotease [Ningiella sp. W23]|uniref:zinc-dependent metalloprotease n=1 Tax=Ningiella sp. W23 TaxID=3023715 RepID=UPI0037574218
MLVSLKNLSGYIVLALSIVSIFFSYAVAQSGESQEPSDEDDAPITIESLTKDAKRFGGIFTFYQNKNDGNLMMEISAEQLNSEYLYYGFIQNGVADAGTQRGFYTGQDVIEIRKRFNRIDFISKNTSYYIDPQSPLANGGFANITDAVLASIEILAESDDGTRYLINADEIFLTEVLANLKQMVDADDNDEFAFDVGDLSDERTSYAHVGVYPENVNVRTDYVYSNPEPDNTGSERTEDARATTITVQHSFVAMPDADFVPRLDDNRVGYFRTQVTDLNSYDITPYRDLITRWRLIKKDPNAALSEPVEPIVWWIENTTPYEYRDIMRKGVLQWNKAFEKAGFKNAIVVNIQPDDAVWSADDIRYNVVRWSNTPEGSFAFGPSYINPRTGEILGADVMFEQSFLNTYGFRADVLGDPNANSLNFRKPQHKHQSHHFCSKGHRLQEIVSFGRVALDAMDASVSEKRKVIEQMLYELMLHEVGHTLGLMHNMKASNLHSLADIHHEEVTQGKLSASVMDYGALVIAPPGIEQGDFFMTEPGVYDDWAIQFGYDPEIEGEARVALLSRSTERELSFGNDADDMRSPGAGIDPDITIWDMSDDGIGFAEQQFELIDAITPNLLDKMRKEGESHAKIRAALGMLISYKYSGTANVANYIGGVHVDRAKQGQKGASVPYSPVGLQNQKRAMNVLKKHVLSPEAFSLPASLIAHAAMQPRGFEHYEYTEDPKIHEAISSIQHIIFDRLLDPVLMTRMTDTQLYGNEYSVNAMLADLSDAVFASDIRSSVNTKRQNLQIEYIHRLTGIISEESSHDYQSQAASFHELNKLVKLLSKSKQGDDATQAHRAYALHLIELALDKP